MQAQARRGRALHPGQGQLRRRHQAARHAARRLPSLEPRPCADRQDRCVEGQGAARRRRGADRRGPEARQARLDADAGRRCADGAGRRQGPVPEPGDRLRRRDRPLYRGRRRRPRRGRVRAAAGARRSVQGDGAGRAGGARGHQGQDGGRARAAQASEPHLHLGGRRPRADRRRFRQGGGGDQGPPELPARPPLPARDLPDGLQLQQGHRRPHDLRHVPGAACHPHGGGADRRAAGAEDPRDLARHRRRLRQQGRRLSGLYLRRRRLDRHRPAGQMGRGPDREPVDHLVRPRLPHDDRDRRDEGRPRHGAARPHSRRPRRVRRLRRSVEVAGGLLQHRHRLLRLPGRPSRGRRGLHQQGAGRRRLSLLVPGDRGRLCDRARDGHHGAEAGARSGRLPHEELHQARAVPLSIRLGVGIRLGRLSHGDAEGPRSDRISQAARGAERRSRRRSSAARRAS